MQLGLDYYISARLGVLAGLARIFGTQAHHAIEMLLKAKLVEKHALEKIKKEFGHNIEEAWRSFKALFPAKDLTDFDRLIQDVHAFETIRYPDSFVQGGQFISATYTVGNEPPQTNPSGSLSK